MPTFDTANALTVNNGAQTAFTDINESGSHSLQNASGNDRGVYLFVEAASNQVGDLTISGVTYNAAAPTAVLASLATGGSSPRARWYVAFWNDAALPATSGSYTCAWTIGNCGSAPETIGYIIEATGIDQTTPHPDTTATNTNFGTTGQTFNATSGDEVLALISGTHSSNGTDPAASWGTDNEFADIGSAANRQSNLAVGYASDGGLTGTLSIGTSDKEAWVAFSVKNASAGVTLTVADLTHSHALDAVSLTQQNTLSVNALDHSHLLDNVDLVQQSTLTIAAILHSHTLGQVDLVQAHTLAIQELLHDHSLEAVDLVQANLLTVDEMNHSHQLDNVVLQVGGVLEVQEVTHGHTLDGLSLVQANILAVDALNHSHLLDNIDLTQASVLTVQSIDHAHTLEAVTLDVSVVLQVADISHAQAIESPALVQQNVLSVLDMVHSHTLDSPALTAHHTLIVSDMLHSQAIDNLDLFVGAIVTPDSRVIAIPAEDRLIIIAAEDRIFSIQ